MKKLVAVCVSFFALLSTSVPLRAADVYVGVGLFSLSVDPVNVKVGDVVYWTEADPDFGPYIISGAWGAFYTPGGIRFLGPGTYHYTVQSFYGGSWNGTVIASLNLPPTVAITSPTNNSQFVAPAGFTFSADAFDPNPNDVSDVEFWIGKNLVDDVYDPPYATTITNLAAGTYTLTAVAWDYSNARTTNSVLITVVNPPPISLAPSGFVGGKFVFSVSGLATGATNVVLGSSNLVDWLPLQTNVADSAALSFTNPANACWQFFRVMQMN